jgi:hypothetical protein
VSIKNTKYFAKVPVNAPDGRIVVHNHVRPRDANGEPIPLDKVSLGDNGFRAWTEPDDTPNRVVCGCEWAPHLPEHYRVARLGAETWAEEPETSRRNA